VWRERERERERERCGKKKAGATRGFLSTNRARSFEAAVKVATT
jgi:hypothetical protein